MDYHPKTQTTNMYIHIHTFIDLMAGACYAVNEITDFCPNAVALTVIAPLGGTLCSQKVLRMRNSEHVS